MPPDCHSERRERSGRQRLASPSSLRPSGPKWPKADRGCAPATGNCSAYLPLPGTGEKRHRAAGGRRSDGAFSAAVGKHEDQRKPDVFSGHRKVEEVSRSDGEGPPSFQQFPSQAQAPALPLPSAGRARKTGHTCPDASILTYPRLRASSPITVPPQGCAAASFFHTLLSDPLFFAIIIEKTVTFADF